MDWKSDVINKLTVDSASLVRHRHGVRVGTLDERLLVKDYSSDGKTTRREDMTGTLKNGDGSTRSWRADYWYP